MNFLRTSLFSCLPWMLIAVGVLWPSDGLHANPAGPAAFVSVIEDLPLMTGLTEDPSAAVVFESASGRIAETVASGPVAGRKVVEFYAATLPQLGWHLESRTRYRREGELLSLEISTDDNLPGQIFVYFRLIPVGP